jgi:hypothetical protein
MIATLSGLRFRTRLAIFSDHMRTFRRQQRPRRGPSLVQDRQPHAELRAELQHRAD